MKFSILFVLALAGGIPGVISAKGFWQSIFEWLDGSSSTSQSTSSSSSSSSSSSTSSSWETEFYDSIAELLGLDYDYSGGNHRPSTTTPKPQTSGSFPLQWLQLQQPQLAGQGVNYGQPFPYVPQNFYPQYQEQQQPIPQHQPTTPTSFIPSAKPIPSAPPTAAAFPPAPATVSTVLSTPSSYSTSAPSTTVLTTSIPSVTVAPTTPPSTTTAAVPTTTPKPAAPAAPAAATTSAPAAPAATTSAPAATTTPAPTTTTAKTTG